MRSPEELQAELVRMDMKDDEISQALGNCKPTGEPPFGQLLDLRIELESRRDVLQWALGLNNRAPSAIELPQ